MSELISGKEALIAWHEGLEIEVKHNSAGWFVFNNHNFGITVFKSKDHQFRLKPRTITINGIEVPAPFEPNEFEDCYMLSDLYEHGYTKTSWKYSKSVPAWRTEEEIKQVVSALRSVFKGGVE